jgi:gamma-aminobutyric acid type B receptor
VHKIFNSEKLKVHDKLQDKYLFKFVGGLLAFDFFVLLAWTVPDPMTKHITDFTPYYEAHGDLMVTERVERCAAEYYGQIVLVAYKGGLLLFGAWLAFSIRNVAIPALNDSKQIGEAIYNVGLVGGILLAVSYIVSSNVTLSYVIPV